MAMDWLSKLGKQGLETLIKSSMKTVFDERFEKKAEPRFREIELDLRSLEKGQKAIESRLAAIEQRLDVAEDIAQLKADVALLKARG